MSEFPGALPVSLDRSVRILNHGRTLLGGEPMRAMRITTAGTRVLTQLQYSGAGASSNARNLARQLIDNGLAHPRAAPRALDAGDVTVIIPARDRLDSLATCLQSLCWPAVVVDDGSVRPAAIAAVCRRYGARLVRRDRSGGPGAARNAGIEACDTELIAFLDSDCVPTPDWLASLAGHFTDPVVGAVAPRIRPQLARPTSWIARFAAKRSPLDLGPHAADVGPGRRVAYVPTAALVVRRQAIGSGFDQDLRHGEDVDFVWRMRDAGWRIRYDPSITVHHTEPSRWRDLVRRRYRYGTSAAPLAARHRGRLAPIVMEPRTSAVLGLLLLRRTRTAMSVWTWQTSSLVRRLWPVGVPAWRAVATSASTAGQAAIATGRFAATTLAPGLLTLALVSRRARASAIAMLLVAPTVEWLRRRPALDPLRWTALCIADDFAYGSGVWVSCLRAGTLDPVRPARRIRPVV
jgi:mycofactocin system glycosyltransferase